MKRRLFALILGLLTILPLFALPVSALTPTQASDVDGDGAVTARDAAILARYVDGWDGYVDENGELTYPWKITSSRFVKSFDPSDPVYFEDGYTFRVLTYGGGDDGIRTLNGQTVPKFRSTHFAVKDVTPWTAGSWSDNNGYAQYYTLVSQVVAERNQYLKDTYNVTVEEERVASPFEALKMDTLCGLRAYDAVMLPLGSFNSQSTVGYLKNVLTIPTVELSREWYDKEILDDITFNDTLYYLTGASDSALRQSVFLPAIGISNIQQTYHFTSPKDAADYLYDLVLSGQWTIEKEIELLTDCYNAYTGTGTHYMISAEKRVNHDHMMSACFDPLTYTGGIYQLRDSFEDCAGFDAWEKLKPLLAGSARDTAGDKTAIYNGTTSQSVMRYIGNTVYAYNTQFRSAKYYLAILPMAKKDGNQKQYRVAPAMGFCYLYAIPKVNRGDPNAARYGFENGTDLAGYLMSAFMEASLAKHNSKGYDVKNAHVHQLAVLKGLHNADFAGKPLRVLQMTFDSVCLDRGMTLCTSLYDAFKDCGNDTAKWEAFSATYQNTLSSNNFNIAKTQEYLALE